MAWAKVQIGKLGGYESSGQGAKRGTVLGFSPQARVGDGKLAGGKKKKWHLVLQEEQPLCSEKHSVGVREPSSSPHCGICPEQWLCDMERW